MKLTDALTAVYQDPNREIVSVAHVRPMGYTPHPDVLDEVATAYEELMGQGEALRRRHPELSSAQAFAQVFSDPANA
jgi:hypothetical protein